MQGNMVEDVAAVTTYTGVSVYTRGNFYCDRVLFNRRVWRSLSSFEFNVTLSSCWRYRGRRQILHFFYPNFLKFAPKM